MVNDLGGQTVVIVFREDDEDGDYRDTGERLPVPGCSVQPGAHVYSITQPFCVSHE